MRRIVFVIDEEGVCVPESSEPITLRGHGRAKLRVSLTTVWQLLASMRPHIMVDEAIMVLWDMNKTEDFKTLCDTCLKRRLEDFNMLGTELCKNSLIYRILFDQIELACQMDLLDVVFEQPKDMIAFYTRVWETLFQEQFPADLKQDDFYIDEVETYDLQRMVFDKP